MTTMASTREKILALSVAAVAAISAGWLGITIWFHRGQSPSTFFLVSIVLLVLFICLAGIIISRTAQSPLKKTLGIIQSISNMGFKDRFYINDVSDDSGKIQIEINNMMDRLEDAMARQRQFVGAISHDIRTPLTIIKGDIEVALMRARNPEEYQEVLRSNLEEVERIHHLVEDLVTLARADYGELGLNVRQVSLSSLVVEVRESFTDQAGRKGLILESYIESGVRINGDQARLRQLLHNLLENAVHYTPAGGRIELTMVGDTERDEVKIRIRDTGIGIPPKDLPHVFEPFYRGTHIKRTRHDGYGLGLAICDHIVKAHGGRISVESREGPGSGSTFTVHLPRRTDSSK